MIGFSDETYIDVASGHGGNGCVSFHREKFVQNGGPDGGDGGKGGNVVFIVDHNLRTLAKLKQKRSFKAENGHNGAKCRMHGSSGKDVEIVVPNGTIIKDSQTGKIIKDLTDCDRFVFLEGGRGGLGNYHFRTSVRQAPKFAQKGEDGVEMRIGLELLVIADIGLVGFPNAGKSSLINQITNSRSEIGAYPFTTKIPQLGVLHYNNNDIIIADIPGILEKASKGAGMGIKFLKHIKRTQALAYCIDLSQENYLETFDILQKELEAFDTDLIKKDTIIIATKRDEDENGENFKKLKDKYRDYKVVPYTILVDEDSKMLKKEFINIVKKSRNIERGFKSFLNEG